MFKLIQSKQSVIFTLLLASLPFNLSSMEPRREIAPVVFDEQEEDEFVCGICLEPMNEEFFQLPLDQLPRNAMDTIKLYCVHKFHWSCIAAWNKRCPMCRKGFSPGQAITPAFIAQYIALQKKEGELTNTIQLQTKEIKRIKDIQAALTIVNNQLIEDENEKNQQIQILAATNSELCNQVQRLCPGLNAQKQIDTSLELDHKQSMQALHQRIDSLNDRTRKLDENECALQKKIEQLIASKAELNKKLQKQQSHGSNNGNSSNAVWQTVQEENERLELINIELLYTKQKLLEKIEGLDVVLQGKAEKIEQLLRDCRTYERKINNLTKSINYQQKKLNPTLKPGPRALISRPITTRLFSLET